MRYLILAALTAAAAVPVSAQAQTAPELKGPYYDVGAGAIGTTVIAMGTRKRTGDHATITRIVVMHKAMKAGEITVWRIDGVSEFDCAKHMTRPTALAARDAEGKVIHIARPQVEWEGLAPADPTAAPTLQAACDGTVPAGAKKFDDLDAWHRQFRTKYPAQ